MTEAKPFALPFPLPDGWEIEQASIGVFLAARRADGHALGWVTVNERIRDFELGMTPVRANAYDLTPKYKGRHWRKQLYEAAITALCQATGQTTPIFGDSK